MKKTYICAYCGLTVERYESTVRNPDKVFCNRGCQGKWQSKANRGSNNPNYKDGTWSEESYCDCGSLKDPRSIQCSLCAKRGYPIGYDGITDEDEDAIRRAVKESTTFLEAGDKLNRNRCWVAKYVASLSLDISHFRHGRGRRIPLDRLLVKGTKKRNATVKKALIEYSLTGYVCHKCSLEPSWEDQELVLELDHINGDPTDNRIENLRFLCPNCHSQTPTAKGRNIGRSQKNADFQQPR